MEGLKIQSVEVTADAAANVLETAVAAGHTFGIGYWASVTAVDTFLIEGSDRERYRSIKVYDHEGGGKTDAAPDSVYALDGRRGRVIITIEHVKKAIAKILEDEHAVDAPGSAARIIENDPDGALADVIIQVACFGKVIYG